MSDRAAVRFGRYELVRRLGRGGMAEVFLARFRGPESFEKRLVIKRILPERSRDRAFLTSFFEEARLHVSLSHGNLVPVFDFGRVGNLYFIAMEYVPGSDLGALIAKGPLSPAEVAYLGVELCRGLGYVHRKGLVHRDVTPRNVLVSTEGEVKLSDFGVALAPDASGTAGLRGTPAFMAPEQARGEPLDGRADLFALGLVLAEALTGKRLRIARGVTLKELATTVPPLMLEGPLGAVLMRAAAADVSARFADAEAMLAALEAAQKELAPSSPARMLAGRVADLAAASGDDIVDADASIGPATYFRDAPTVSEGMEQLRATLVPPPARARRRWILGLAPLLLATLIFGAYRLQRMTNVNDVQQQSADLNDVQRRDLLLPPVDLAMPVELAPAQPLPPVEPKHVGEPEPHKHVAPHPEAGVVRVQCTPWCVPLVDGQRRGDGARVHLLTLPPGKHVIGAQRLDDKQARDIDVEPRRQVSLDFTFQ